MKAIKLKSCLKVGECNVSGCKNKCNGKLCATCRCRKSRVENPTRYAYNNLKNRASQRGVLFTITLEQFADWCTKVTYIGFAGRSSNSYTIDRIHNDIGYHIDNIQVLTKRDNIIKYFSYDYRNKVASVTTVGRVAVCEDLPF